MSEDTAIVVEAEGETVGEAKWVGLRELERRCPGLDRDRVEFEVVSEGERGLLGVGTSPARILARFDPGSEPPPDPQPPAAEGDLAGLVREMLVEITHALGANCSIEVVATEEEISATLAGPDVAVLIGKHGKTIDSIQYLVGAAVASAGAQESPRVVVDAGGYRVRREGAARPARGELGLRSEADGQRGTARADELRRAEDRASAPEGRGRRRDVQRG